ncbi:MAG: hypothetical protein M3112_09960 [Actinomycetia bacterium]|nr:hypothetical protein [Actinomycetes bacterium]
MQHNRAFVLSLVLAGGLLLAACGGSESNEAPTTTLAAATETTVAPEAPSTTLTNDTTDTAAPADDATEAELPELGPAEVGCDWDSERLSSSSAGAVPDAEGSDIAQAVLGSWQHTHIDSGGGFEAVKPTTDIRYVLSSDTFLYCQDVESATDKAERSVGLSMEGTEIILPSPATGYTVVAWDDNTMVWLNHRDDSLYLLKRR